MDQSEIKPRLWAFSSREHVSSEPVADDLECDVLIIGGGFTGCAAAYEAARSGARVVLLEAEEIGFGGSGRNVGLVNAGLWLPPDDIIHRLGHTMGHRLIDALGVGPDLVFELTAQEGIQCDAVRQGTLHVAHSEDGLENLQNRFRQGNAVGAPLQMLNAEDTERRLGTGGFHGALFDPRAGTIQPLAYCRGLARAAERAGAMLFGQSRVRDLRHTGQGWMAKVNGQTITAQSVIHATNAYHDTIKGGPKPSFATVHYSQFATAPLTPAQREVILPDGEGCWDTALVMTSFRLDAEGRLILGTMGNAEGFGGTVHRNWAERKLAELYPQLAGTAFTHIWQGRIAMTANHLPKVVAFGPDAYAIYGYSGRGIAPGTVFGICAARAVLGDGETAFPLPVLPAYSEHLTRSKTLFYEAGATLTHALPQIPKVSKFLGEKP